MSDEENMAIDQVYNRSITHNTSFCPTDYGPHLLFWCDLQCNHAAKKLQLKLNIMKLQVNFQIQIQIQI